MDGVRDLYAARGIILKPVDLTDLFLYGTYDGARRRHSWGMKPGGLAFAKACTRIFQPDGKQYLQQWLSYQAERKVEQYYRGLFRKTGLLVAGGNDISSLFETAAEHVSPTIYGEVIRPSARGWRPTRRLRRHHPHRAVQLPALPDLGGDPQAAQHPARHAHPDLRERRLRGRPSFLRQVEVHIQQVLAHAARDPAESVLAAGRLPDLIKAAVGRLR